MVLREILPVINNHIDRYPGFGPRDAYKLAYQYHLGLAHLGKVDSEIIGEALRGEYHAVKADPNVPIIEPLSTNADIVRLNLAAFKHQGLSLEKLLLVFYESRGKSVENVSEFKKDWNKLVEMSKRGTIRLPYDAMRTFDLLVKKSDYPACHHSEQYSRLNSPAYRIVSWESLIKFIPELRSELPIHEDDE